MGRYIRIIVISSNLLAAFGIFLYGRSNLDALSAETASLLASDHLWLGISSLFYCINFAIAWRFRNVWTVSSTRMLIWAVAAYLGISHLVDLVGINWHLVNDILTGVSDDPVIRGLRARICTVAVLITMAVTCIAVGFESGGDRED